MTVVLCLVIGCGAWKVLKCLNFICVGFHTFSCEKLTVNADYGMSYFALVAIED